MSSVYSQVAPKYILIPCRVLLVFETNWVCIPFPLSRVFGVNACETEI
jgi:hypothetical protein